MTRIMVVMVLLALGCSKRPERATADPTPPAKDATQPDDALAALLRCQPKTDPSTVCPPSTRLVHEQVAKSHVFSCQRADGVKHGLQVTCSATFEPLVMVAYREGIRTSGECTLTPCGGEPCNVPCPRGAACRLGPKGLVCDAADAGGSTTCGSIFCGPDCYCADLHEGVCRCLR